MINYIAILYTRFLTKLDRFSQMKNWQIKLSLVLFVYILFVAFPSFDLLHKDFAGGWTILFRHADHLLTPVPYAPESHEAKLAFRLLIPVIVRLFHLNMLGVLLFQFLAGWVSWILFMKIIEKFTGDKITAAILALAMACINFSKCTLDIRGVFFDNIAFLFLLIPFVYTRSIIIFICITLAAWIDERAFVASSFLFLFLLFNRHEKNSVLKIASVVMAWIGYIGLRYYLSQTYHLSTPTTGAGFTTIIAQMNNWHLGIISGLEGFWIFPLLFILYKIKERKWLEAVVFSANILVIILIALSVVDISRSMSYLFISIPLVIQYLSQKESISDLRKIAAIALVLSFLFPAYYFSSVRESYWSYPLPLQIIRIFFVSS